MNLNCSILVVVFFSLSNRPVFSQDKGIDSLKHVLLTAKEDTTKVNVLNDLSQSISIATRSAPNKQEFEKAIQYSRTALSLSEKLEYQRGCLCNQA